MTLTSVNNAVSWCLTPPVGFRNQRGHNTIQTDLVNREKTGGQGLEKANYDLLEKSVKKAESFISRE